MSRRTTLQHTIVAVMAAGVVAASPAIAKPIDRIDRFDDATPTPHQDLRGEHATDPAPPGSQQFQPGQPTWPTHPAPVAKPAAEPAPATGTGGDSDGWLIAGIGLAAGGIVACSAAGAAHRYRVRARRVAT